MKTDFICVLDIKERDGGGGVLFKGAPCLIIQLGGRGVEGLFRALLRVQVLIQGNTIFFFILHESKLHETGQLNPTTSVLCLNLHPQNCVSINKYNIFLNNSVPDKPFEAGKLSVTPNASPLMKNNCIVSNLKCKICH